MTILDIHTGRVVQGVLQKGTLGKKFQNVIVQLGGDQVASIRAALDEKIEGKEVHTAAWMAGKDWVSAYKPIADLANGDRELSGSVFGMFVWDAFERHPENWFTDRTQVKDGHPGNRVYWRQS